MDIVHVFSGSSGLNTTVDPVRIRFDPETGVVDLAAAVNVVHDKTGRPSRRPGYTKLHDGTFHSLFCDGGECCVGRGTDLYVVNPDLSLTGIRSGLSGNWLDYAQVAHGLYYCNGADNGVVRGGLSYPWPVNTYTGPDTTRQFSPAPVGQHLAHHGGRMYIADGGTLWYSEPYAYGLYDKARSFLSFKSRVLLVRSVEKGLFVSDTESVWFLRGGNPREFVPEKKTAYPALEWSAAVEMVEIRNMGFDVPGLGILMGSTKGALLGTPDGQIINLTESKVVYPQIGLRGAGLLKGDNFIHSLFY